MTTLHSESSELHVASRRQTYTLLTLGMLFLLAAWLLKLNPFTYPVGVLCLGLGMLVASIVHPTRLVIASCMLTALGIAVFLFFKKIIPGNQVFPAYILAIGIALLAIAFFARRGYVGQGAFTPAFLVIIVGIIEALLVAGLTPPTFLPFMLSLWLPGLGLLILGMIYLITSLVMAGKG